MANHILHPAVIPNWAFIPDKNASSDLLQSVNLFARRLRLPHEAAHIVDELFIQTKGFPIGHNTSERRFNFSMNVNNTTGNLLGMIEIPRQELWQLPPNASQAISIAFPTLGAILKVIFHMSPDYVVHPLYLFALLPKPRSSL